MLCCEADRHNLPDRFAVSVKKYDATQLAIYPKDFLRVHSIIRLGLQVATRTLRKIQHP